MSRQRMRWLLPCLVALLGLFSSGCRSTQTFEKPYPQMESILLQRLNIPPDAPAKGSRWVHIAPDPQLARCLTIRTSQAMISDEKAGQRIRLTLSERYDIGSIGGQYLQIDVRKIDDNRTRVAVNYLDKAVGFMVIPFAYVNPGWIRERTIGRCLFEDRPPSPSDQACESLQGRSCGPRGAELPCATGRCLCEGTWDCHR